MKRAVDIVVACLGLLMLSPVLAVVAIAVKLDTRGPVFFKHDRVGRAFRPIKVLKFRTMTWPPQGPELTAGRDQRITRIGRLLRRTKIDELPQLANVIKGDMSLVGPRPEVRRYVDMFRADYEEILKVRPGITDLASVEYRDESTLLGATDDPEALYVSEILPRKISLAKDYVRNRSLLMDLRLLLRTVGILTLDRFRTGET